MGGGKSGGSSGDNTIRYAPHIENAHAALLALSVAEESRLLGIATTPWDSVTFDNVDTAFFSVGHTIASNPSLFDTFETFVSGIDIETLYNQILADMVSSQSITDAVDAQGVYLQDEIDSAAWPRIAAGYRDINCVMASAFIDAKTLLQVQKTRVLSKYDSDLRVRAMELANQRYGQHLEWNRP
jgi:hypothetical protein